MNNIVKRNSVKSNVSTHNRLWKISNIKVIDNQTNVKNLAMESVVLAIGALFFIATFVIAVCRITYPYELEWMEGGTLQQIQRIIDGQPIYAEPSIHYVPFIYTPLYFYLCAVPNSIFGNEFIAPRILSMLCALLSMLMIARIVYRETSHTALSLLSALLFAACYRIGGAWFDIARVDTLYLLLLLCGFHTLRYRNSYGGAVLAGLLFALAFMTKQSTLVVAIPLLALLWYRDKTRIYIVSLVFVGLVAASIVYFNHSSEGWFHYYIFDLPNQHEVNRQQIVGFWAVDILSHLPIAVGLIITVLFMRKRFPERQIHFPTVVFTAILVLSSYAARLHSGGYDNVLLPAYAGLAIGSGVAVWMLLKYVRAWFKRDTNIGRLVGNALLFTVAVQFGLLFYNPLDQIPTSADISEGERLEQIIDQSTGNVWIPYHPYLSQHADKGEYAHACAVVDIIRGEDSEIRRSLMKEFIEAVQTRQFQMIVIDSDIGNIRWLAEAVEKNYPRGYSIVEQPSALLPRTGLMTRPVLALMP